MSRAQSYGDEQAAIMKRLGQEWADRTPVAWPNTHLDPDGATHIEPRVNRQEAFNVTLGTSKRVRHPGLLTVEIRAPRNSGDEAIDHGDYIAEVFRNVTFDGITFRAPTVRTFPPRGSDTWYRVQVDCPFWRDSHFDD